MYPASTIAHELEHARRRSKHDEGGHDMIKTGLWLGDPHKDRSFNECANDVFSKVIAAGFYLEMIKIYK